MSSTQPTPADEHRRHLAYAVHHQLEDLWDGVLHELGNYHQDPQPLTLECAADLLREAEQRVRALQALAHA